MNEDLKDLLYAILSTAIIIGLIFIIIIPLFIWLEPYLREPEDKIIIQGVVDDMRIEPERGFGSEIFYIISIEGKEVQVEKKIYDKVFIGDYITIYESGKVEIGEKHENDDV